MAIERVLKVEGVSKVYGQGESKTVALNDISFEVLEGEFLGIMGASGSGKTTLLNCIATMVKPTAGRISLQATDISSFTGRKLVAYRGKEIGYLFQNFELLDNLTVRENIVLPLSIHGVSAKDTASFLQELATRFDIANELDKFPAQLSGGQKQRAAAARALILKPSIVLADEPTGALDSKNSKILLDMLSEINKEDQKTIMMVTHDANAASYCSRIIFIQDGQLFHELRKKMGQESTEQFYERIVTVIAQLGGGSANVL